jgi:hypothetical protein
VPKGFSFRPPHLWLSSFSSSPTSDSRKLSPEGVERVSSFPSSFCSLFSFYFLGAEIRVPPQRESGMLTKEKCKGIKREKESDQLKHFAHPPLPRLDDGSQLSLHDFLRTASRSGLCAPSCLVEFAYLAKGKLLKNPLSNKKAPDYCGEIVA